MRQAVFVGVSLGAALLGCHTITEELPTRPNPTPLVVTLPAPPASVPAVPGTMPTPTTQPPAPAPTPKPTPAPSQPSPPTNAGDCTNPTPGPLAKWNVYIHINGSGRKVLDSTPLVGPDAAYCAAIGYTDGRRYCPPRPEGHPQVVACITYVVGTAQDTGRVGPTWTANGKACVDNENGPTPFCINHPDNQFLVYAYGPGTYEACAKGVCGSVVVD